jgi:acetoin utilization deacetylase AcuC-like enzyme
MDGAATFLFAHLDCLKHSAGPGHPESPERLRTVLAALGPESFPELARREAPLAGRDVVTVAHDPAYVESIMRAVPATGLVTLDPDTALSPGTGAAALRAAGAAAAAVDAVLSGEAANAFCAVRPPGHHAERARAMGFCLFNNIAIGALHARVTRGLDRVAAVDFDVHHGNGTEQIFRGDPGLFFASTHQSPAYPGTGTQREITANLVNVPLPPGTAGSTFRAVWADDVLPALAAFEPEMVLISAGFDGHARDPLAGWELEADDFAWVTAAIAEVAATTAQGRVVSLQEGGYDLEGLASSVAAHVAELVAAGR